MGLPTIAIHVPDAVALSGLMLGVVLVASGSELMLDRNQRPRGSDDFRMPRLLFHNLLGPVGVMGTNRRVRRTATATRIGVRQATPYHASSAIIAAA